MKFNIGDLIILDDISKSRKYDGVEGTIVSKSGRSLYYIKWVGENVCNWYRSEGIEESYKPDYKRMRNIRLKSIL